MRHIFFSALVFLGGVCAEPPAGRSWKVIPEFTDEFEGAELDASKWWPNNPTWTGRHPGWFAPENVRMENGKLNLYCTKGTPKGAPSNYTHGSAFVKSKKDVLYGYFEVKCRSMKSYATSAFWFYKGYGIATAEHWVEIDVIELRGNSLYAGGEDRRVPMGTHVFKPGPQKSDITEFILQAPHYEDYHVYGLEWNKDSILFYVDGQKVKRLDNTNSHYNIYYPMDMCFDSEIFADFFGIPLDKDLPSVFSIEYIRSWKDAGPAVGIGRPISIRMDNDRQQEASLPVYDIQGRQLPAGSFAGPGLRVINTGKGAEMEIFNLLSP